MGSGVEGDPAGFGAGLGDLLRGGRLREDLRSVFFWLMEPDQVRRHLGAEARFYAEAAHRYREYAAAKDRGDFGDSPRTRSLRITVEAGARLYEALAGWAEWAQTVDLRPPAQ